MSNVERTTNWQQIQLGVKDTERLIVRGKHSLVMVEVRQVLEYMVRCVTEHACLVEGDLSGTIGQLYKGRWVSEATKDNYHTICIPGNKAVHERDNTAYDANQAYQLLTQEVYVFADEFFGRRSSARAPQTGRTASPKQTSQRQGSSSQSSTRSPQSGNYRPAQSGGQRQGGPREKKYGQVSPVSYTWRLLIPTLIVVLLIVVICTVVPSGDKGKGNLTTAPAVTTTATEPAPTLPPEPETIPEAEPPVAIYRIKGNNVSVRMEPSADSRIIVQLTNGTGVDYVECYSNDWDVINYDRQGAYVPSRLLEKVEPIAETEVPATSGSDQNSW